MRGPTPSGCPVGLPSPCYVLCLAGPPFCEGQCQVLWVQTQPACLLQAHHLLMAVWPGCGPPAVPAAQICTCLTHRLPGCGQPGLLFLASQQESTVGEGRIHRHTDTHRHVDHLGLLRLSGTLFGLREFGHSKRSGAVLDTALGHCLAAAQSLGSLRHNRFTLSPLMLGA